LSIEQDLARYYCSSENLMERFIQEIHPKDEMYLEMKAHHGYRAGTCRYHYFKTGNEALTSLKSLLACCNRPLKETRNLLEFACGYGRLTRYLACELDPNRIWACDIYKDAVDFVEEKLGVTGIYSQTEPGDLCFDRKFHMIYVGSLFSHLPRDRFSQWLAKLYEALDDDGMLVFSTHGTSAAPQVKKDPSGYTFARQSESRSLKKNEYGSTFVDPDVVRQIASDCGINHLHVNEKDLLFLQDIYVVAKQNIPGIENWQTSSIIQGFIDKLVIDKEKNFRIEGWAIDVCPEYTIKNVSLQIDLENHTEAFYGRPREDIEMMSGRPEWLNSGWLFEGVLEKLSPGKHIVSARALSSSGCDMLIDLVPFDSKKLPFSTD